jgi:hypothetical protein
MAMHLSDLMATVYVTCMQIEARADQEQVVWSETRTEEEEEVHDGDDDDDDDDDEEEEEEEEEEEDDDDDDDDEEEEESWKVLVEPMMRFINRSHFFSVTLSDDKDDGDADGCDDGRWHW